MANRTALELTTEEKLAYRPGAVIERRQQSDNHQQEERWQQARRLAPQAAKILYEEFSAARVLLFGSAVRQLWFTPWSDIDLAVWGIPSEQFYAAVAAVTGLSSEIQVDIVDAEHCSPALRTVIERDGIEL